MFCLPSVINADPVNLNTAQLNWCPGWSQEPGMTMTTSLWPIRTTESTRYKVERLHTDTSSAKLKQRNQTWYVYNAAKLPLQWLKIKRVFIQKWEFHYGFRKSQLLWWFKNMSEHEPDPPVGPLQRRPPARPPGAPCYRADQNMAAPAGAKVFIANTSWSSFVIHY